MKKVVKQDASPASNARRSSRVLSADNSRGKKVTGNENITPKKKTTTPSASPASSSRRSSTSSRKQTKETPPTNMRKSVRLENMNSSDTPQSKEKTKKKKAVQNLDQSMTNPSKNKGQEKPSLGADGRKRKRGRKKFFSRVKQKRAVADGGDKAKDSVETSSEAITCSSSSTDVEDKLHPLDSSKTEYSVSKSVEDKDDSDDECSDRKASKSQCGEETNVNELLNDYLVDLDKAKHVGCHSSKSVDGESIECGSGESSSSESEKPPQNKQQTNPNNNHNQRLPSVMSNPNEVEAIDFEADDDDLMEEDAAVDIDTSSSHIPKLKSAITGGAEKKTKGRGFRDESDADRNNRMSGRFDSLGSDGGPGPERSIEGWIILVTGVHEEAQEDDLQNAFGEYGEIKNLHLNLDRRTGFVKGYALIEYESFEEAEKAIAAMDGGELLTQIVNVDWAFSKGPFRRRNNRRSPRRSRSPPRRRF